MNSGTENTPRPFRIASARSLSAVLITCEHASNRLPFPVAEAEASAILRSHWAWDIGAWSTARELSRRLGAAAIGARWSRLLVDLNRPVKDPTLIRRVVGEVRLPWNRDLTPSRVEQRILAYHAPYHEAVDRLILRHLVRGVEPILVAVHTFTPELDGERRDFDAGVLFTEHDRIARRVGRALHDQGLRVRYNEPYSGLAGMMYSVDRHGRHHVLRCLELEFNQSLFKGGPTEPQLAGAAADALKRAAGSG